MVELHSGRPAKKSRGLDTVLCLQFLNKKKKKKNILICKICFNKPRKTKSYVIKSTLLRHTRLFSPHIKNVGHISVKVYFANCELKLNKLYE